MTHAYVLRAPVHAQLPKVHIQMIIHIPAKLQHWLKPLHSSKKSDSFQKRGGKFLYFRFS